MTAVPTTTGDKPWPHPWPKGGRPPKIANAKRWGLYVDSEVQTRADARAKRKGTELPDVMRALMADYAAGRITPSTDTHATEES